MGQTLKRPIERLAYRRPEAAAALGVSETKFADWERRGLMPDGSSPVLLPDSNGSGA